MNSYIKNYPRPQLVRPAWTDLNGTWKFQFDDHDKGETGRRYETFPEKTLQIEVPFTYETKCSGVEDTAHHAPGVVQPQRGADGRKTERKEDADSF